MDDSREALRAAVVGGVNIDVGGISHAPLVAGDSNPGTVHFTLGGVGRNIAHNLSLLGVQTSLLTALGEDPWAERIERSCRELHIDLGASLLVPGETSSVYLYLAGPEGDMALAVSDMDIYRHLTPAALSGRMERLQGIRALVLDTNLPAETIEWLCEHAAVPVFADAVSVAKAGRLRAVLGKLQALKVNRLEAELLSGIPIRDGESLNRAAEALLKTGLRQLLITLGAEGVLAAEADLRLRLPAAQGEHISTTGCGDAFLAALVWAELQGMDLRDSARAGIAAAAITMADEATVSPKISAKALRDKMEKQNLGGTP